ncbi:MAG: hypothetical protein RXQ98_07695 [Sulfolobaceae archaeon]
MSWIILPLASGMFFGLITLLSIVFGLLGIIAVSLPYNLERNPRYRIIVPIESPGYEIGDVIGRTILFILSISMLYLINYITLAITTNTPILSTNNIPNPFQFIVTIPELYSYYAQSASSELSSAVMLVLITIITFIFLSAYVMLFSAFIARLINIGAVIISVKENNEVVFEFLLDDIYPLLSDLDIKQITPRVYKLRFTSPLKIEKVNVDLNTLSTYFKQSNRIGNFIVGVDKFPIPGYVVIDEIIYAPINYKEGYVINGHLIVMKGFDKAVKELAKIGLAI